MYSDYPTVCQTSQLSESLLNHQQDRLSNKTLSNPLERISSIQQNVESENISSKNSNSMPVCIEYKIISCSSSSSSSSNLNQPIETKILPLEILLHIFNFLSINDMKKVISDTKGLQLKRTLLDELIDKNTTDPTCASDLMHALQSLASKEPERAGIIAAEIVNTHKLPFEEIAKVPQFERYVLPHLQYCDFSKSKASDDEISRLLALCPNIRELHLPETFNDPIPLETLEGLTDLVMGVHYNKPFAAGTSLANLRTLTMGWYYNQPFPVGTNLGNLHTWIMGDSYNQSLPNGINLTKLRILIMGCSYNHTIPPEYTGELQTWTMGTDYNQPVPSNLHSLHTWTLGMHYSQPFSADIDLSGLEQWDMKGSYNQLLPERLNLSKLHTWTMAGNFNQRIPDSVTFGKLRTWIIGQIYNQAFPDQMNLSKLERLEMGYSFKQSFPNGVDLGNLRFIKIKEGYAHPLPGIDLNQFTMEKQDGFCQYSLINIPN
jgi:hypothetical protein